MKMGVFPRVDGRRESCTVDGEKGRTGDEGSRCKKYNRWNVFQGDGWPVATCSRRRTQRFKTPLHFSEVLSTVPSILFHSFISYYTFCFLGLLCNNLYSFACYRCNHFCFWFVVLLGFALFFLFFLNGLGVLLRITHYRWCRFFFAQN